MSNLTINRDGGRGLSLAEVVGDDTGVVGGVVTLCTLDCERTLSGGLGDAVFVSLADLSVTLVPFDLYVKAAAVIRTF